MHSQPILRVQGLSKTFDGLRALDDYNLDLFPGEIVGIIGPNGAGKTTVFNLLTGFLPPTSGTIALHGHPITGIGADRIARMGIARTFQNIRLFRNLSVVENVLIATQIRRAPHDRASRARLSEPFQFLAMLGSLPVFRSHERVLREEALSWLELFGLRTAAWQQADSLAYGDQRRLEIARAMATQPAVLLLDEPAAGMNPSETDSLLHLIRSLRDRFGVAIVLVEHDMRLVMQLCERVQVLNYGRLIAGGAPDAISNNPAVIAAYLGQESVNARA